MPEQTSIFDQLAALNPQLVVDMRPEPGWVWAACPACGEIRYLRRRDLGTRCILTIGCEGRLELHLGLDCAQCHKPVTARRSGKDTKFCSKRCEDAFRTECEEFGCHD